MPDLEDPNLFARSLFGGLPRRYEVLAQVLSFGQNGRWQRRAVAHLVPGSPARVLDVATGTGRIARLVAARSRAEVVGVDLTEAMLRQGLSTIRRNGQTARIRLVAGRAERLPFADGAFDAAVFSYLLRYVADPEATLRELARVVKSGGVVASLEFFVPPARFWRACWWWYTRGALPVAGLLTGGPAWYRVGRFLGPSISEHYRRHPLPRLFDAWRRAGFVEVSARVMSLGGGLVMWGTKGDG